MTTAWCCDAIFMLKPIRVAAGMRFPCQRPSSAAWVGCLRLGPQAIVYPGQHQHARVAIQFLSGEIRQERIFTHLGWKKVDCRWVYLNAGEAIGSGGPIAGTEVDLPKSLQRYLVRPPKDPGDHVLAIRASLHFLSLAPDRMTFPLLAAVYRAPFGRLDFSIFLAGLAKPAPLRRHLQRCASSITGRIKLS